MLLDDTTTPFPTPGPVTDPINPTTYYFLGAGATSCIMITNLLLAFTAVSLNLVVITFYWRKLNKTVPFMYFILGVSDLCTGISTLLHFFTFLIFLIVQAEESPPLLWVAVISYFCTIIFFRLSAFVSLLFSVIRTMNIISPFTRIKKRVVMICILCYTGIWISVFLVELVLFSTQNSHSSVDFFKNTFYEPGLLKSIQHESTGKTLQSSNLFIWALFLTVIPITLPAVIAVVLTGFQVFYLVRTDGQSATEKSGARKNRQVEITIIMITLLFSVCSSFVLLQPIYWADRINSPIEKLDARDQYLLFYIFGYVPMFVNAALNPAILILRGENLRRYFKSLLGTRDQTQSVVIGNRAARPQVTFRSGIEETAN